MVFVSANADNIPDLAAFHGPCQPVWLFLIDGEYNISGERERSFV